MFIETFPRLKTLSLSEMTSFYPKEFVVQVYLYVSYYVCLFALVSVFSHFVAAVYGRYLLVSTYLSLSVLLFFHLPLAPSFFIKGDLKNFYFRHQYGGRDGCCNHP